MTLTGLRLDFVVYPLCIVFVVFHVLVRLVILVVRAVDVSLRDASLSMQEEGASDDISASLGARLVRSL